MFARSIPIGVTCMAGGSPRWAFSNDHSLAHRRRERGPSTPHQVTPYPELRWLSHKKFVP